MFGITFLGISRFYRLIGERMRRNVSLVVTNRAFAPVVVIVVLYGIVVVAARRLGRIVAAACNRHRREYRNQRENECTQPNSSFHFSSRRRSYFAPGVKSKCVSETCSARDSSGYNRPHATIAVTESLLSYIVYGWLVNSKSDIFINYATEKMPL